MANGIDNGPQLFFDAYDATVGAAGGKDVWITETGWPVSGPVSGQAEANVKNAKYFWDKVACPSLGKINTYWYTLQDSYPNTPSPSFGVLGTNLGTKPLFDLSCPAGDSTPSTSGKAATSSTEASPSSIVSSGGSLTPTEGAGGVGAGSGSGSGNASSTLVAVPSSGAGVGNGSTVGGGAGSASPTGGAGTGAGSASPSGGAGGAGSASPSGGAGGAGSASP